MKTESISRIAGIAIVPASAIALIGLLAQGAHVSREAGGLAELIGGLALVLALPALTARMAARAGGLGLAGMLLITFVILDFQVVGGAVDAFVIPVLSAHGIAANHVPGPLGLLLLLGVAAQLSGSALLAFTTLRRRPLPVLVGWLWAAALLAGIIGVLPFAGVFDVVSGVFAYGGLMVAGGALALSGERAAVVASPGSATAAAKV